MPKAKHHVPKGYKSPAWAATERVTRKMGKKPTNQLTRGLELAIERLAADGFGSLSIYRILRAESVFSDRPTYPSYRAVARHLKEFAKAHPDVIRLGKQKHQGASELARYEGRVIRVYGSALALHDKKFEDEIEEDEEALEDCSDPAGLCGEDESEDVEYYDGL